MLQLEILEKSSESLQIFSLSPPYYEPREYLSNQFQRFPRLEEFRLLDHNVTPSQYVSCVRLHGTKQRGEQKKSNLQVLSICWSEELLASPSPLDFLNNLTSLHVIGSETENTEDTWYRVLKVPSRTLCGDPRELAT